MLPQTCNLLSFRFCCLQKVKLHFLIKCWFVRFEKIIVEPCLGSLHVSMQYSSVGHGCTNIERKPQLLFVTADVTGTAFVKSWAEMIRMRQHSEQIQNLMGMHHFGTKCHLVASSSSLLKCSPKQLAHLPFPLRTQMVLRKAWHMSLPPTKKNLCREGVLCILFEHIQAEQHFALSVFVCMTWCKGEALIFMVNYKESFAREDSWRLASGQRSPHKKINLGINLWLFRACFLASWIPCLWRNKL